MKFNDLLNKLEAQEQSFLDAQVLAPVVTGRAVTVRIAGIVCRLEIDDHRFQGWAILQPVSTDGALVLRAATRREMQQYLQLLPAVQLIAVARRGRTPQHNQAQTASTSENDTPSTNTQQTWLALPAHQGDGRFGIQQAVPVALCDAGVQPFDAIIARFDGQRFWFERRDARRNPAFAAYLRQSFNETLPATQLSKKGLSGEERKAYAWAQQAIEEARLRREAARAEGRKRDEEARSWSEEGRLADALAHADGQLLSFIERDDVYTVNYRVGNRSHTSIVRKDDLSVVTSGICLSGLDNHFDLTSVVGVMREAAVLGRPDLDDDY